MSTFDRVAWCCSWVAPACWIALLLAILGGVALGGQVPPNQTMQAALPVVVLVAASLGLAANTIFISHILGVRRFSSSDRRTLLRYVWFGFGYRKWRAIMRSHRVSA